MNSELVWGAFKQDGTLVAVLSSESEAYFYVQNRGHMHGGSYLKIPVMAAAPKMLEALRFVEEKLTQSGYPYGPNLKTLRAAIAEAEGQS